MKEVPSVLYEAFDGKRFATAAECREHESKSLAERFVDLTLPQVEAALNREDAALADAFEKAGQRIGAVRRAGGELRRKRGAAAEPPMAP